MKQLFKLIVLTLFMSANSLLAQGNFYDFVVKDIDGKNFAFTQLKGKKVMLVNVASKCGYTHQYEALEDLFKTYKEQGFVIIAFPANNFMKQEPGTDAEIKEFCSLNYGVTFPIMSKISVKGDDMHPIDLRLTQKEKNGNLDSKVKWSCQKYLIDENGNFIKQLNPGTKPNDAEIIQWIAS